MGERYLRLGERPGPRPDLRFDLLVRTTPHLDTVAEALGIERERATGVMALAFAVVRGTSLIASANACLAEGPSPITAGGADRPTPNVDQADHEPAKDRTAVDTAIVRALAELSLKARDKWLVGTGHQFDLRVALSHLPAASDGTLGLARIEVMPDAFDRAGGDRIDDQIADGSFASGALAVNYVVGDLCAWFERSFTAEDGWLPSHTGPERIAQTLQSLLEDSNEELFDRDPERYAPFKNWSPRKPKARAADAA